MFQLTEQEVRAFVGPKADYYLRKWKQAVEGEGRAEAGINWAAFLLSALWIPYRKMYPAAVIFLGAIAIESILEEVFFVRVLGKPGAPAAFDHLVGLAAGVICGAFGNQWYLSHARKVIAQVRSQGLPEEEHLRVLAKRGGTSLLASLGIFVIFIVVFFAVSFALEMLFRMAR